MMCIVHLTILSMHSTTGLFGRFAMTFDVTLTITIYFVSLAELHFMKLLIGDWKRLFQIANHLAKMIERNGWIV